MKKKPPAKRKPSLDSIYRRVLALHTTLLNQMALIRLDIVKERQADRAIIKTLADHASRLLKEKETLMKAGVASPIKFRPGAYDLHADAERFMSERLPTLTPWNSVASCAVAHLHRANVPCAVCGSGNFEVAAPWKHTGECNSGNSLRRGRNEAPQCICGVGL
jgi:hypothetical protein